MIKITGRKSLQGFQELVHREVFPIQLTRLFEPLVTLSFGDGLVTGYRPRRVLSSTVRRKRFRKSQSMSEHPQDSTFRIPVFPISYTSNQVFNRKSLFSRVTVIHRPDGLCF